MVPNHAKHLILSSNIKLVTNVKSIAGAFNGYFVDVGSSLSKQTPETLFLLISRMFDHWTIYL